MTTTTASSPLLRLEGVTKRFGATTALDNVRFDLRAGEVHALVGENGAGKSTLMKILAGNVERDSGRILFGGRDVSIASPADAAAHGIAIIHQELSTVPHLTVAENLSLGREPTTRFGTLDRREVIESARRKLARIGAPIDPRTPLGELSVGKQQMVEIARAIGDEVKVLVLDEPTAALTRAEAQQLYRVIDEMRTAGVGLIYISHRMEEIWQLADRITVFRDGTHVGTRTKGESTTADVVRMMVGRPVDDLYRHDPRVPGEVVLDVRDLTDGEAIGPVSFAVRAGEVVCLAGLVGAGRTEIARLVFGADPVASGAVRVNGEDVTPAGPSDGIAAGIAMLPENRKEQALFLEHSVEDNIAISSLGRFGRAGVLKRRQIRQAVLDQMRRLRLRESAVGLSAQGLSGGNQQKATLARWLMRHSQVLILDEPTRGVDIGARSEIYEVIDELARAGKAVLVVSSDLPEVLGISDRVLVVRDGRIVRELVTNETSEEEVMTHATGTVAPANGASHG